MCLHRRPQLFPLLGSFLFWATLWIGTTPALAQGNLTMGTTESVLKVVSTRDFLALMTVGGTGSLCAQSKVAVALPSTLLQTC